MRKLLTLATIVCLPLPMAQAYASPPIFFDGANYEQEYNNNDYYGNGYYSGGHEYGVVSGTYGRPPVSLNKREVAPKEEYVPRDYGSVYDRFISASDARDQELSSRGLYEAQKRAARVKAIAKAEEAMRQARALELAERGLESGDSPLENVDGSVSMNSSASGVDSKYTDRGHYSGADYDTHGVGIDDTDHPDYSQYY